MERFSYVFLCSNSTEQECLKRSLLGGRNTYFNKVKNLQLGDTLFLYNYVDKHFIGPFIAASLIKENIQEDAWNGQFPLQVRVKRVGKNKPLSRGDIGDLIKFARNTFPQAKISSMQTRELIRLLQSKKRVPIFADETPNTVVDGHRVRSLAEAVIDDWLYENKILHAYEYPIAEGKRCDFYIPTSKKDGIYIEYWGLTDLKYLENKKKKLLIYKKFGFKLIEIFPKDLKSLDKILAPLKQ